MDIKFYMTIGDWSEDGHGKMKKFLIQSNQLMECVRDVHFGIKAATGIDIEAVCSEYGNNIVPADIKEQLELLGYHIADDAGFGECVISPEEMINIWLFLLMYTEPSLSLKICEDPYPEFQFFGIDEKDRHIGSVGYGLFLD